MLFLIIFILLTLIILPKPIHKLLAFLIFIITIALSILNLNIHYLAYALLITYVGGIAILFLFIILLTNYLDKFKFNSILYLEYILLLFVILIFNNIFNLFYENTDILYIFDFNLLNIIQEPTIYYIAHHLYIDNPLYIIVITNLILIILVGVIYLIREENQFL